MNSQDTPTVGQLLRDARQATGASIADVAAEILVPQHYLAAIEADQYAGLPGQTYAVGFVRNYSRYLDLDADDIVDQLKREVNFPRNLDSVEIVSGFVDPPRQNVLPSTGTIAAGLCIGLGVYALWFAASANQPLASLPSALPGPVETIKTAARFPQVPSVPAVRPAQEKAKPRTLSRAKVVKAAASMPAPVASQQPEATEAPAADLPSKQDSLSNVAAPAPKPVPPKPAPPKPVAAAAVPAVVAKPTPPVPAAPADMLDQPLGDQAYVDQTSTLEAVHIHVAEESWVEVRTGESIFYTGVKQAGDILSVPGDMAAQAKLTTGNAGGIWVSVGDWTSQTLGKQGRVRRDLALSPDALLATLQAADPS